MDREGKMAAYRLLMGLHLQQRKPLPDLRQAVLIDDMDARLDAVIKVLHDSVHQWLTPPLPAEPATAPTTTTPELTTPPTTTPYELATPPTNIRRDLEFVEDHNEPGGPFFSIFEQGCEIYTSTDRDEARRAFFDLKYDRI